MRSKLSEASSTTGALESKRGALENEIAQLKEAVRVETKAKSEFERAEKTARAELSKVQAQVCCGYMYLYVCVCGVCMYDVFVYVAVLLAFTHVLRLFV